MSFNNNLKGDCIMKKVIITIVKHFPYVTTLLGFLMWLGLHLATDGSGNVDNRLFVSKADSFAVGDILSMIGHHDNGHLFRNMVMLVIFCTAAEILLGSKRFAVAIICTMVAQTAVEEAIGGFCGIGASGWLMATPGLMLWAAMRKVDHLEKEMQCMGIPFVFYMANVLQVITDVRNINNADNIGHTAHIIGFCVGMLFVLAALPIAVRNTVQELRTYKRRRISRKKWAIRQLKQIEDGMLIVSPHRLQHLQKLAA